MAQRIALVTGGMGGLGEAICVKLDRMGIKVIVTYSPSNTKHGEWLSEMAGQGHKFFAYSCDVMDFDSCAQMVAQVVKDHGPVDILINNAGITRDMTFKKMTKPDWDAVMHTNLDSVFNVTKPVVDGMVERGWGRVINVSSVNGQKGAFGQTNYSAAKAGMHGFQALRQVARKGVTVLRSRREHQDKMVLASEGRARLESFRRSMGRLGKPNEVAGLCRLASDGRPSSPGPISPSTAGSMY
jgi:acetoacetyl-CoA reductase